MTIQQTLAQRNLAAAGALGNCDSDNDKLDSVKLLDEE